MLENLVFLIEHELVVDGSGILDRDLDRLPLADVEDGGGEYHLPVVGFLHRDADRLRGLRLVAGLSDSHFFTVTAGMIAGSQGRGCEGDQRQCQYIVLHE
ncbi:hypothetical protein AJ87_44830 [Rhizobium yanglingense]|nr:hypothetical protein AJ87_44830 [Rhizobium yanglingense]